MTDKEIEESKQRDEKEKSIEKFYQVLKMYLAKIKSNMSPRDPTPWDGNCFFHAIIDQMNLLGIEDAPTCHKTLREAVCDHLGNLPEEMTMTMYGEEGLEKLAEKYKQDGEWVAQEMVQATAYYLNRNIIIYSPNGQTLSQTKVEGGEGSDEFECMTIFGYRDHYQSIYADKSEKCHDKKKRLQNFYQALKDYLVRINSNMSPRDLTLGDGNCFFHAIVDQINLLGIEDAPTSHQTLREAVCHHLSNLPEGMNNYIRTMYGEEGLEKLAEKYKQDGEWVAQEMVQATAYYLNRNIIIYSPNDQTMSQLKIEGGEGSDDFESMTIFYYAHHYQSIYAKNAT